MTNYIEEKAEKFVLTPAMARLIAAEGLLMATGRLGGYEGKTVREELKDLLSKERAHWLRSEIEKLEGMKKQEWSDVDEVDYNQALDSIITRYKEELKAITGE